MSDSDFKYIIARLIENAHIAVEEARQNKNDPFYQGHKLAYYEVLDTIKNELDVRDQNPKNFGLDMNLEEIFL